MRRQQPIGPYCILFLLLFLFLSLPKPSVERLRGHSIALMAPAWEHLAAIKTILSMPLNYFGNSSDASPSSQRMQQMELENLSLKSDVVRLKELFQHELRLLAQVSAASTYRQHEKESQALLAQQLTAIPAQVVYRAPSSWNSSLWINVGEENNKSLAEPLIVKNSPIIVGSSVVGVIDFVGKHQSRVRLITDSGLTPSVRVARGAPHRRKLFEDMQTLISTLATQNDLAMDPNDKNTLIALLEKTRKSLSANDDACFLAKGEIHGSSAPLWRGPGQSLKGIGFNYDFPDNEGPARDLRTGKPTNASGSIPTVPLMQKGDLLVTTGFDGVFPPGLHVGIITKVHPLKEGDYTYDLDATPTAGNLYDLSFVYVIPPLKSQE